MKKKHWERVPVGKEDRREFVGRKVDGRNVKTMFTSPWTIACFAEIRPIVDVYPMKFLCEEIGVLTP